MQVHNIVLIADITKIAVESRRKGIAGPDIPGKYLDSSRTLPLAKVFRWFTTTEQVGSENV